VTDRQTPLTERAEDPRTVIRPGCSVLLVVEDDASLLSILSEAMSEEGFRVFSTGSGAEALALYRENADDTCLAIIDVMLPGMDGITTAIEMRKINDNICFLFMSGYDTEDLKQWGIRIEDIPNAEFFRKPFAFEDMRNRIRMLVTQT
jgi:two-component system, cell cycle sensor histidine kinase and response regulator CckA